MANLVKTVRIRSVCVVRVSVSVMGEEGRVLEKLEVGRD